MSSFIDNKSTTKGVLPLEVTIAGRPHITASFFVDSNIEYNALLGRDWIHQTSHSIFLVPSLGLLGWQIGFGSFGR